IRPDDTRSATTGSSCRTRKSRARRHRTALPGRLDTEEVTGSNPVSPTSYMSSSGALLGGALEAATEADAGWRAAEPHIPGLWAQVRIYAAIAHLLRGEPDAASGEVGPVLDMPPDLRISTVTGLLVDLDGRLRDGRHATGSTTIGLRRQI